MASHAAAFRGEPLATKLGADAAEIDRQEDMRSADADVFLAREDGEEAGVAREEEREEGGAEEEEAAAAEEVEEQMTRIQEERLAQERSAERKEREGSGGGGIYSYLKELQSEGAAAEGGQCFEPQESSQGVHADTPQSDVEKWGGDDAAREGGARELWSAECGAALSSPVSSSSSVVSRMSLNACLVAQETGVCTRPGPQDGKRARGEEVWPRYCGGSAGESTESSRDSSVCAPSAARAGSKGTCIGRKSAEKKSPENGRKATTWLQSSGPSVSPLPPQALKLVLVVV